MMLRVYQSIGLAFLFVPINTAAYVDIKPEQNNQVSALMNLMRNIGASVGISLTGAMVTNRAQFHQAQLGVAAASVVGSPQGIAPPRLPQIRTCGFFASGSSVHGFATWRGSGCEAAEADSAPAALPFSPTSCGPVASGDLTTYATRRRPCGESCGARSGCR